MITDTGPRFSILLAVAALMVAGCQQTTAGTAPARVAAAPPPAPVRGLNRSRGSLRQSEVRFI